MNPHRSQTLLNLLGPLLVLAGCASSAPLSFVEGIPQTRTDPTLYPVRVVSVDGSIQFSRPSEPVQIAPGPRWLVLEAAPGRGAIGTTQRSFALKVEPCTRYYLGAKRNAQMDADWTLVVDGKEAVAGCNPEEELKKAGLAPAARGASGAK